MRVFQVIANSWRSRVQLLEDGCEVLKAGLVNSLLVKGVKILCCSLLLVCFEFCILMIAHITPIRLIVAHLLGKDCLDGSLQDHNDQPLVQRRELRFKLWWWDEMTTTCCNKYVYGIERESHLEHLEEHRQTSSTCLTSCKTGLDNQRFSVTINISLENFLFDSLFLHRVWALQK